MITGHNTDVEYDGQVYHVQTEDKGRSNPVIETLIYSKGAIVEAVRSSYAEIVEKGYAESEVISRIERQHTRWVREVRNGRFDPEGPKPFGYNLVTNRSFDEVVLTTVMTLDSGPEICIELLNEVSFFEGTSVIVDLLVKASGGMPMAEAEVRAGLVTQGAKPRTLFKGHTDEEGKATLVVDVPEGAGPEASVVIQIESGDSTAELSQPILSVGALP